VRILVFWILEGVPDRVLDGGEGLLRCTSPLLHRLSDLLRQPVLALEAVFEADQGPAGVFSFDAKHGRGDDFAFELLDPGAPLVDGVLPVDGIDGDPMRQRPIQGRGLLGARELLPLGTVIADPPARGRVAGCAPIPIPVAVRRSAQRSGRAGLVGFVGLIDPHLHHPRPVPMSDTSRPGERPHWRSGSPGSHRRYRRQPAPTRAARLYTAAQDDDVGAGCVTHVASLTLRMRFGRS
jgi:hypothetical protein